MTGALNRRKFIQTSVAFIPFSAVLTMPASKPSLKLSFSTLGCPDWTFPQIVDFAAAKGYDGIEIRGIQRQIDLTSCDVFKDKTAIAAARQRVRDAGLKIVNLGSSAALHHTSKTDREKNLSEAKRYIDLAEQLKCPYVRVFPNNLPKDDTRAAIMELIIQGLQQLGDYAKGSGVTVLLESHGDVVRTDDLLKIMTDTGSKQVALIWDITNMWTVTRESPEKVYTALSPFIKHVHIKDATITGDKLNYVLLGQGQTSIMEGLNLLHTQNYSGYYSFEWEKLWHPEIADPEIALADFPKVMQQQFGSGK